MGGCDVPYTHFGSTWLDSHILTMPFGLGTTTIPAHHSVEVVTFEITPSFSILSNSAFTLGNKGTATRLGVVKANGLASLSN